MTQKLSGILWPWFFIALHFIEWNSQCRGRVGPVLKDLTLTMQTSTVISNAKHHSPIPFLMLLFLTSVIFLYHSYSITLCLPFLLCMLLLPRGTREFIVIQQNIKLSLASRKEHLFHIPKSFLRISEQAVLFCFLIEREFHVFSKHKNSEHCSIWANITSAISWQRSCSIGLLPLGREQEG